MKKSLLLKRIWRWMNREKKLKRKRKNGLIKKGRRKKRLLKREDESEIGTRYPGFDQRF
jgi:hypothetical protein